MNEDTVINLAVQAMMLAMKISAPILGIGLLVGLVVSVLQAITQIQEQSLQFIPKVLALAAVIVIGGPWMLGELLKYTSELWRSIPDYVG